MVAEYGWRLRCCGCLPKFDLSRRGKVRACQVGVGWGGGKGFDSRDVKLRTLAGVHVKGNWLRHAVAQHMLAPATSICVFVSHGIGIQNSSHSDTGSVSNVEWV